MCIRDRENLTVTMVLQPDLTPSECAALCKKVQRFNYITNVEYTSKEPVSYTHLDVYKRQRRCRGATGGKTRSR